MRAHALAPPWPSPEEHQSDMLSPGPPPTLVAPSSTPAEAEPGATHAPQLPTCDVQYWQTVVAVHQKACNTREQGALFGAVLHPMRLQLKHMQGALDRETVEALRHALDTLRVASEAFESAFQSLRKPTVHAAAAAL